MTTRRFDGVEQTKTKKKKNDCWRRYHKQQRRQTTINNSNSKSNSAATTTHRCAASITARLDKTAPAIAHRASNRTDVTTAARRRRTELERWVRAADSRSVDRRTCRMWRRWGNRSRRSFCSSLPFPSRSPWLGFRPTLFNCGELFLRCDRAYNITYKKKEEVKQYISYLKIEFDVY